MAKTIKIFDTTLRDGEQSPGCSMNIQEKLKVAAQLGRLKVDVIEAGFAIASPGDFAAVQAVAKSVQSCTVASLARALPKDIDRAWEAVKFAARPRLHIFLATSPIHMQYKLRMQPEQVLASIKEMVSYGRNYCDDIEFSAEDATRSEPDFLYKVFEAAIACGAKVINIPDTVGYSTPDEFYQLVKGIRDNVANIDQAEISVHCHNDLGMAVANTLAAVKAGATQLECTINGIGERAGNAGLEEVVMALSTRQDVYDAKCGVETTEIYKSSKLITALTGIAVQPNKAIVGANAFAHEAGIHQHGVLANKSTYEIMTPSSIGLSQSKMVLGKHSGKHAFKERLTSLGYHLTSEELAEAFDHFKQLADKKKVVSDADIEALIQQKSVETPKIFTLERYVINSGNLMTATAAVVLSKDNCQTEEVSSGDGPIDAAYKAIDKIVGIDFSLSDYVLRSVTGGKDAQGDVIVKLSKDGELYTGHGLSTDVIEASLKAYVNAVNRMLGELRFLEGGEQVGS